MSQHEMGARFCYVDECRFGLYTSRTRGRAVRGLPAKKITGNQRTPHITMLCAISPNVELIHRTIIVGGARQSHFDQIIEELFGCDFGQPLVESQGFDKTYIILDNAPCHRGVESRLSETIPRNFELVRLPPRQLSRSAGRSYRRIVCDQIIVRSVKTEDLSLKFHQVPPFSQIPPGSTIQSNSTRFDHSVKFHQVPPFSQFPPGSTIQSNSTRFHHSVKFHQIPPFSRFHQNL